MNTLTQTFHSLIGRPPIPSPAQRRAETLIACRNTVNFPSSGLSLHTCRHISSHALAELGYYGVSETHDGFGLHGRMQDVIASLVFEKAETGQPGAPRFRAVRIQVISRASSAASGELQRLQGSLTRIVGAC